MTPTAILFDSTRNNIEALVTVKRFHCFSMDSQGTCAHIPGILKWISLWKKEENGDTEPKTFSSLKIN